MTVPLREALDTAEQDRPGQTTRVFYLAVPPAPFQQSASGLGKAGLYRGHETARNIMEKPFGRPRAA